MMLADDAELWLLPCHVLMKNDVRCHIYLSVLACVKVWYATNRRAGYVDNNSTTYNIHMTQYIYIFAIHRGWPHLLLLGPHCDYYCSPRVFVWRSLT